MTKTKESAEWYWEYCLLDYVYLSYDFHNLAWIHSVQ